MENSIRIKTGIDIEVNDKGETINIDIKNVNFVNRFNELGNKLGKISESIDTSAELSENEQLAIITEKMTDVCNAIDEMFNDRACAKVFGEDVIPTPDAVIELMEALKPFIRTEEEKRKAFIEAKSKRRTGGKRV